MAPGVVAKDANKSSAWLPDEGAVVGVDVKKSSSGTDDAV
jgi:hypothetical protein